MQTDAQQSSHSSNRKRDVDRKSNKENATSNNYLFWDTKSACSGSSWESDTDISEVYARTTLNPHLENAYMFSRAERCTVKHERRGHSNKSLSLPIGDWFLMDKPTLPCSSPRSGETTPPFSTIFPSVPPSSSSSSCSSVITIDAAEPTIDSPHRSLTSQSNLRTHFVSTNESTKYSIKKPNDQSTLSLTQQQQVGVSCPGSIATNFNQHPPHHNNMILNLNKKNQNLLNKNKNFTSSATNETATHSASQSNTISALTSYATPTHNNIASQSKNIIPESVVEHNRNVANASSTRRVFPSNSSSMRCSSRFNSPSTPQKSLNNSLLHDPSGETLVGQPSPNSTKTPSEDIQSGDDNSTIGDDENDQPQDLSINGEQQATVSGAIAEDPARTETDRNVKSVRQRHQHALSARAAANSFAGDMATNMPSALRPSSQASSKGVLGSPQLTLTLPFRMATSNNISATNQLYTTNSSSILSSPKQFAVTPTANQNLNMLLLPSPRWLSLSSTGEFSPSALLASLESFREDFSSSASLNQFVQHSQHSQQHQNQNLPNSNNNSGLITNQINYQMKTQEVTSDSLTSPTQSLTSPDLPVVINYNNPQYSSHRIANNSNNNSNNNNNIMKQISPSTSSFVIPTSSCELDSPFQVSISHASTPLSDMPSATTTSTSVAEAAAVAAAAAAAFLQQQQPIHIPQTSSSSPSSLNMVLHANNNNNNAASSSSRVSNPINGPSTHAASRSVMPTSSPLVASSGASSSSSMNNNHPVNYWSSHQASSAPPSTSSYSGLNSRNSFCYLPSASDSSSHMNFDMNNITNGNKNNLLNYSLGVGASTHRITTAANLNTSQHNHHQQQQQQQQNQYSSSNSRLSSSSSSISNATSTSHLRPSSNGISRNNNSNSSVTNSSSSSSSSSSRLQSSSRPSTCKCVRARDTTTGEELTFSSMREAARSLNLNPGTICRAAQNKQVSTGGGGHTNIVNGWEITLIDPVTNAAPSANSSISSSHAIGRTSSAGQSSDDAVLTKRKLEFPQPIASVSTSAANSYMQPASLVSSSSTRVPSPSDSPKRPLLNPPPPPPPPPSHLLICGVDVTSVSSSSSSSSSNGNGSSSLGNPRLAAAAAALAAVASSLHKPSSPSPLPIKSSSIIMPATSAVAFSTAPSSSQQPSTTVFSLPSEFGIDPFAAASFAAHQAADAVLSTVASSAVDILDDSPTVIAAQGLASSSSFSASGMANTIPTCTMGESYESLIDGGRPLLICGADVRDVTVGFALGGIGK